MKQIWLIENFEEDNRIWEFADALKSLGHDVRSVDYTSIYLDKPKGFNIPEGECVAFQGSIQVTLWLQRHKKWIPTCWLKTEMFKCTTYYSYLGKYLLNQDYEFTTKGEFLRRVEEFYTKFSDDGAVFIRPDSGLKSFSGQLFFKSNHSRDWVFFGQYLNNEDIVIVSSPKNIKEEWRFVVADGQVIASSRYHLNGELSLQEGSPPEAMAKAQEVADAISNTLKVDALYCLDIGYCNAQYYLVEINSFSCAGLYACDKLAIAKNATRIAEREWLEYNNVK